MRDLTTTVVGTLGLILGLCSPAWSLVLCTNLSKGGALTLRVTCGMGETQIGSFDGTTLQLSGINLQIVSGSGATDGAINGKGNLIVGYNENTGGHMQTGSHNLIVGSEHTFTSFGGLVAGENNTISGPFASVSGGTLNTASGAEASVSGGQGNTASDDQASVSGGFENTASGLFASVSGGDTNTASGDGASVSGGRLNTASGRFASLSGGNDNTASGTAASIGGGAFLTAAGTEEWHSSQSAGFPTGTEY